MHSSVRASSSLPSQEDQSGLRNEASYTLSSSVTLSSGYVTNNTSNDYLSGSSFLSPKISTPLSYHHHDDLLLSKQRRGSLPLKKRRVFVIHHENPHPLTFQHEDGSGFRVISSHLTPFKSPAFVDADDGKPNSLLYSPYAKMHWKSDALTRESMESSPFDKMNTLSLIAAAAAVDEAGGAPSFSYFQPSTDSSSFTSPLSSFDRVGSMRKPNISFLRSYDEGRMDDSSESSEPSSRSSCTGGCSSTPTSKQGVEGRAFSHLASQYDNSKANVSIKPVTLLNVESSCLDRHTSSLGQDKRFTGLSPDQIRCHATTTRGRPCTYTAVQNTKYCFLHADYDTNPPPRRTKSINCKRDERDTSTSASTSPATTFINTDDDVSDDEMKERIDVTPSLSLDSPNKTQLQTRIGGLMGFKKRRTNAKFAEKHAEAPRPLLSMMATDQWFGQSVQIAVGPFEGQTGIVQKWGNGWITVLIEGVGFHNRRSFELFLATNDGIGMDSVYLPDDGTDASSSMNSKNVKDKSRKKAKDQASHQLFRCVSRDVVSPSPPNTDVANVKNNISNGASRNARTVTPKVSSMLSPRTKKEVKTMKKPSVVANTEIVHATSENPQSRCVSDGAKTPVPVKSNIDGSSSLNTSLSLPTPKVTPSPEKNMTVTRLLNVNDRPNIDLQFPGPRDDETKKTSNSTKLSNSSLIFRPSMGERTRGRTTSIGDCCNQSGDSLNSTNADNISTTTALQKKHNSDCIEEWYD
jgi:hypothetical protein